MQLSPSFSFSNLEGCWIKDMNVLIDNGNIVGYKVNVAITFVLDTHAEDRPDTEPEPL